MAADPTPDPDLTGENGAPKWKHRPGDLYRPMFGDWWGDPESGYRQEWNYLTGTYSMLAAAKRAGFRAQGSDDFNIGVIRDGQLVASLWMDDIVDEDPAEMAAIVESAGAP